MLDCNSHLAGIDEEMVVRVSASSAIGAFLVLDAGHLDRFRFCNTKTGLETA